MPSSKRQKQKEVIAYVGLGSNVGDRRAMLDKSLDYLRKETHLEVGKISSFYETAAVGGPTGQADYLNGVVKIVTQLGANELLERLLSIENRLGRQRKQWWGPRRIDLDLLLYGQEVIETERLQVPHPLMHQREFVLRGLAEIAGQVKHPVLNMTAKHLWQEVLSEGAGT